ncbi:MAG TPA: CBS domain-containing protein [Tepidisphaeraceae bacterium]|nr:CBS domain-containing protein [Tepidisphaeraceae bacterium]
MHTAIDILREKGGGVYCTTAAARVIDAIHQMNRHKIGALVVMADEHVAGIFTERDVLRRVIGEGIDARECAVGQVMTSEIVLCRPETPMDEVSAIMQQKRVRHLPVIDLDGHLHGMISIGDVNACHASEQEMQIHCLNDYIYGRA